MIKKSRTTPIGMDRILRRLARDLVDQEAPSRGVVIWESADRYQDYYERLDREFSRILGDACRWAIIEGARKGTAAADCHDIRTSAVKNADHFSRVHDDAKTIRDNDAGWDSHIAKSNGWIRTPAQLRLFERLYEQAWQLAFNDAAPQLAFHERHWWPRLLISEKKRPASRPAARRPN